MLQPSFRGKQFYPGNARACLGLKPPMSPTQTYTFMNATHLIQVRSGYSMSDTKQLYAKLADNFTSLFRVNAVN